MKPKKRQKLCHNCEGEVDVDVIVCPFCAADLREEAFHAPAAVHPNPLYPSQQTAEEPLAKEKNIFIPTILFTLGVQLCLLGILMLLFSHGGVVALKWDARFCFFYLAASAPLLVFGYKMLSKL